MFWLSKTQVLPKVQDQTANYSTHIYIYNFCIVKGSSKDSLIPNDYCYTWMEHEHKRDFLSYSTLRLCTDSCGGQNCNSIVIGMLSYFLTRVAPSNLKEVQLIFPITGHSFLTPDRVFASIKKKLRKLPVIIQPTDRFFFRSTLLF